MFGDSVRWAALYTCELGVDLAWPCRLWANGTIRRILFPIKDDLGPGPELMLLWMVLQINRMIRIFILTYWLHRRLSISSTFRHIQPGQSYTAGLPRLTFPTETPTGALAVAFHSLLLLPLTGPCGFPRGPSWRGMAMSFLKAFQCHWRGQASIN